MFRKPSKIVVIRVKGDSMRNAGIFDGNFAVIETSHTAIEGQFVVASMGGEFTLKELNFENKRPVLLPRNSLFAPIHPKSNLKIFDVVQSIVQNYGLVKLMQVTLLTGDKT